MYTRKNEIRVKCEVTESHDIEGLCALVIDDQRTMRTIVRALLKQIGITSVVEAGNGAEALRIISAPNARKPDFVICDLHMDGMDGLEFCNKLRLSKSEDIRHIPIIMLTGDSDQMLRDVTTQVGVSHILTKPVSAPQLQAEIAGAVGYAV